ncbi:hypothetical protein MRB53_006467 [Persea americana]|uniref:Uncharacterized protein n=1 Tax=Persea americana TaxID=3435 RepID=A0ACC2MGF7_PERAE|nr:hypothetical protein MRB53_006467 [Persea americana]
MAHHSQLLAILKASAKHKTPSKGKQIHAHIIKSGLEQCSILPNNLIHMYGKCGLLQNALSLFDKMPHRDVVSWASILATLTHADQSHHALAIFPNMITLTNPTRSQQTMIFSKLGRSLSQSDRSRFQIVASLSHIPILKYVFFFTFCFNRSIDSAFSERSLG